MRYLDIPHIETILRGSICGVTDPRVVCIHGATTNGSAYFETLRLHLAKVGIASLAFDFIGAGKTGGDMNVSSLKDRFEQARSVIDGVAHHLPLVLIGASMGADTAIRLSQQYPTSALILFVPGVYARHAYTVSFNEEFTSMLRSERSWEDSESFDILSRFSGSLLIIGAGDDEVVSREILDRLLSSAKNAHKKELTIVPRSSHSILSSYFPAHQKEFVRVFEKVYHAIVGSSSSSPRPDTE